jgi:hypothetical protein
MATIEHQTMRWIQLLKSRGCVNALGLVGYDISPAVPQLLNLHEVEDRDFQSRVGAALFGQKSGTLVRALIRTLEEAGNHPPLTAIDWLGSMGTNAAAAAPALRALLRRESSESIQRHPTSA